MHTIGNPWLWGGFAAVVIVALLVDLVLMRHGGPHKVTFEEALWWSLGWIALASGACSFVYEIGWIRLLNQALGTTLHSFELMLAAFLLGLAFGGAWVQRRAARLHDPLRVAALAQVAMGVAALLSLLAFAHSFDWTAALVQSLARTDGGYRLYLLGSAVIAMAVMLPAAFFAGMTLPLFTLALLRDGAGEAAIGRLYAANTLGAIAGVLLMVHVLVPLAGVRAGIMLAAAVDVLLGFWLLAHARGELAPRRVGGMVLAAVAAFVLVLGWGRPDPRAQLSGAFRTGFARLDGAHDVDARYDRAEVVRGPSGEREDAVRPKRDDAPAAIEDRLVRLFAEPDPVFDLLLDPCQLDMGHVIGGACGRQ